MIPLFDRTKEKKKDPQTEDVLGLHEKPYISKFTQTNITTLLYLCFFNTSLKKICAKKYKTGDKSLNMNRYHTASRGYKHCITLYDIQCFLVYNTSNNYVKFNAA